MTRLMLLFSFLFAAIVTFAQEPQAPPPQGQSPAPQNPAQTAPQAARQTGTPLTLAQAEATALRNNPQITIGKLRALQAQQYVRETRSALLPTAYLSLTGVDTESGSRLAAGAINSPLLLTRAAAGATVTQLVTDFGRTTNQVSSSQFQAKAEDKNAAATAADITLAVDQAFYNALETRELMKVAEETIKTRQTLVDRVGALTQAKLRSDLDLSFANVDLSRAKLLLLESQNNFQSALAALSALLGYPDEQTFDIVEQEQGITPPSPEVLSLIAQALQQRPEVAALQFQVESAQKNSNAEHDLWRPTVSAFGVAGVAPVRDPQISNWYGAVGVNINIPVFNGFLYNARAKVADLQTEATRQRLMDLRNNVARDVRISWQDANQAFARLTVTRELREQANLALDLALQRYNLGLSSIVEFSQAELGKTEADITDTDARYRYRLSQIVLSYTVGAPR
jgi:outer membrane protein